MPKTKKVIKSKQKISLRKKNNNISLKTIFFSFILIAIALIGLVKVYEISNIRIPEFKNYSEIKLKFEKPKELISPYPPTGNITATPIPLSGFCLHVPIIMYHHIQPESNAKQLGQTALTVDSVIFEAQMAYLSQNGYTTLFANELTNALINHQQLPEKSIVITMDDGYEDNYIYALPVLQKYGLKANIALATGLMGNSNMLSWDEINSLKSSGLIYFSNHTWSHYPVTKQPQTKIESEIETGHKQILEHTGQSDEVFIYPYGQFNNNVIDTLTAKGYKGAISEIPGTYQCDSFIMTLHRTRIGNGSLASYGL